MKIKGGHPTGPITESSEYSLQWAEGQARQRGGAGGGLAAEAPRCNQFVTEEPVTHYRLLATVGACPQDDHAIVLPCHRPFIKGTALRGVKVKMNAGGGEKFTIVAMGMTLQAWRRFPWKPASRCSITHPGLYLSSDLDGYTASQSERQQRDEKGQKHIPPFKSLTISPSHLKSHLPGKDFPYSISFPFNSFCMAFMAIMIPTALI